jgi:hypothetical protein
MDLGHESCICNEFAPALSERERQKWLSKQVTLAAGAVVFINLLVLAANWSITAHAKVGGMDFSALEVDAERCPPCRLRYQFFAARYQYSMSYSASPVFGNSAAAHGMAGISGGS